MALLACLHITINPSFSTLRAIFITATSRELIHMTSLFQQFPGPSIHYVITYICLPCGKNHRVEVGLPTYLDELLENLTLEETLERTPEVLQVVEQDEFQHWILHEFLHDHHHHDVRVLFTKVENMRNLVSLRMEHYLKMTAIYEQYRSIVIELNETMGTAPKNFHLAEFLRNQIQPLDKQAMNPFPETLSRLLMR